MLEFAAPPLGDNEDLMVDWLELTAFFSDFGVARVDDLVGSQETQSEEQDENIGDEDSSLERTRESLENEITERAVQCGPGYPFYLTEDAEEVCLRDDWDQGGCPIYITCLLASHVSRSPIMDAVFPEQLVRRLRNRIFQTIATVAMAGCSQGSSVSIGWPRMPHETILDALRRAVERGADIVVKENPGPYTAPEEKDGGIDVIAWTLDDRPPPISFYYAQAASGHDWPDKSVKDFVEDFERNYMADAPRGNRSYATLIPFRETDEIRWKKQHLRHGSLFDRSRVTMFGARALELRQNGAEFDESENLQAVIDWVRDVKQRLGS